MDSGSRRHCWSLLVGLLLVIAHAQPATAQFAWGVHAAKANETGAGGVWGAGAHLRVGLPVIPVDARAAVEYFRPDCVGSDDCTFWGWSIDARLRVPAPLVSPYFTGGLVRRHVDLSDDESLERKEGIAVGWGVEVGLGAALRAFVEARYEFVDAPSHQLMWRLGFYF